ncbi:hypothetical protein [Streptomyces sp. NPDC002580]|uniref:hypothetical protein n=1 Tax=Streptomyces sp. NPDC002580 TaxID=3364653 RepID=UPI003686B6DB
MGERRGDGGTSGRPVARPVDSGSGRAALETSLAAAMRGRADSAEAEARAVAAFLAGRDGGGIAARTRRRDDWRPTRRWSPGRSMKAVAAVLLAGLALGGVAYAAGPFAHGDGDGAGEGAGPRPSNSVPDRPSAEAVPRAGTVPSDSPGISGPPPPTGSPGTEPPDRSERDRDTQAHCRAYVSVGRRGNALNATAWRRLVTAAGGEDEVEAYCAGRLAEDVARNRDTGNAGHADDTGVATGDGGDKEEADGVSAPGAATGTPKPTRSADGK